MNRTAYKDTDGIRSEHAERGERIRARLQDFARVPANEHFYELAYCLLTPQSSAVNADAAVARLKARAFREQGGDPAAILRQPDSYIRFHNTKARRLLTLREQFMDCAARLAQTPPASSVEDVQELRAWFVAHVNGLGMKEASHFLRNIGYRGLAILDRHILRNLRLHGIMRAMPATLTTARYHAIETRFRLFAEVIHIDMDELDLLFWSRETGEIRK
jgi:N-glycosylase/DNA lyase